MRGYRKTFWTAVLGLAALAGVFVLSLAGRVPAWAGWAALLGLPILGAMLYIGFVGRGSPNDEHPNPIEMFARGGRT